MEQDWVWDGISERGYAKSTFDVNNDNDNYFSDSVNSISCNCFSLLTFNFTFNGCVDNFYSTMPTAWICLENVSEKTKL